jgi:NAD(P)-dependent dehydrogenase (short-subunit alcohol dehydrogenase family)
VVVTGGNGGIGRGIVQGVTAAGGRAVIWARNQDKASRVVQSFAEAGYDVDAVTFDLEDESGPERAIEQTVSIAGEFDGVFANAGMAGVATKTTALDLNSWRSVFKTNVDGTFLCLRDVANYLIDRGKGGSIVAVTSIVRNFGAPREPHYAASKAAITSLVRSLAVELGPHHIRCNALAPGWIDTEMIGPGSDFAGAHSEALRIATVARTPVGRWGTPEDLSPIAAYLASPEPHFHTGDVITVDGGYSIT